METRNTTTMKYIDWVKGVIDGTIIPLPRVPSYQFKPVNSVCDSKNSKRKLAKVCPFPQSNITKKKDTGQVP